MISASKYQHIIYFMLLLKVSLCINRPKQRLLIVYGHTQGCRSKRSPTPWKKKNIYFRCMGAFLLLFILEEGFMLRFSSHGVLFSSYRGLLATFSLRRGLFHNVGAIFAIFFLHVAGLFCLHVGFYVFMFFLWACLFQVLEEVKDAKYTWVHGRPQGGGQEGALAPPPWKFKNTGAPTRIT